MSYRPTLTAVTMVTLATLAAGAPARGADPTGKDLYLQYCSSCHGDGAKGDGVAGTAMKIRPPDLTLISSRHGGEFPMDEVVRTIDGREPPRAHGAPAMPVWGERLADEIGGGRKQSLGVQRRVQGRILAIAEYLQTIQAK